MENDKKTVVHTGSETVVKAGSNSSPQQEAATPNPNPSSQDAASSETKVTNNKPRKKMGNTLGMLVAAAGVLIAILILNQFLSGPGQRTYKNARFGYEFAYPVSIVNANGMSEDGTSLSFASANQDFNIHADAGPNVDSETLQAWFDRERADVEHFRNARVIRSDAASFAIAATHQNVNYLHKVIFSCGGQIVNLIDINYPATADGIRAYQTLSEDILESFRAGRGADTPANC